MCALPAARRRLRCGGSSGSAEHRDSARRNDPAPGFLAPGLAAQLRTEAAQVSLGRTPGPGAMRVLGAEELERQLPPALLHRLLLPAKLEARRPVYRLEPQQLRAALERALHQQGIRASTRDLQLSVGPLVDTPDPQFRVLDISVDALHRRWNVRVGVAGDPQSVPFLVTLPAEESLPPRRLAAASRQAPVPPRVRAGQTALLTVEDAGFQASIPVVCLENGVLGQAIRVRDPVNSKIHQAIVSEEGGLHSSGAPND